MAETCGKDKSQDIRAHLMKEPEQIATPKKRKTRGLSKNKLACQSSSKNLSNIPDVSVFRSFVLEQTADKQRDKILERAPVAKVARDRAMPAVIHPEVSPEVDKPRKRWRPDRFENTTKNSVQDFLRKEVGCYDKEQHKAKNHICKRGKTYAQCGATVKDGKLWCCGKVRKIHRGSMNNHVHTKKHDQYQVCVSIQLTFNALVHELQYTCFDNILAGKPETGSCSYGTQSKKKKIQGISKRTWRDDG